MSLLDNMIKSWGYPIWPMDIGIYIWIDLGISTQVNL